MKIVVIGTGYVGLVQGVCLAELGNQVTCIDIDEEKIKKLSNGISPIYEPGLEELLAKNLSAKRLKFSLNLARAIKDSQVIFIAVGTPSDETGQTDLQHVISAATEIGKNLNHYQVIVNRSTVPIGTGELVKKIIKSHHHGQFDVISNPEFLSEGNAIGNFMNPDRIIIGNDNGKRAAKKIIELYKVLNAPILETDLETAEMIKYASNSYLATQISFINSIASICEKVGADVQGVARGMRLDKRIGGKAFLDAGLGYGGSCFPKDVRALIRIARDNKTNFKILEEVEKINITQRQKFVRLIKKRLKNLQDKKIALWGLAFKPKTDDIREAPSITIIERLLALGCKITAYDPVTQKKVKQIFPQVDFADTAEKACKAAEALVIITEWDEFKQINLAAIKQAMNQPIVFDGRNIYDHKLMAENGFEYYSIGKKPTRSIAAKTNHPSTFTSSF